MTDAQLSPTPPATTSGSKPSPWRGWLRGLVREVLLPTAVLIGLLAIAVVLIEGPPLQQFLYAVF
jgi:hypothetical protein